MKLTSTIVAEGGAKLYECVQLEKKDMPRSTLNIKRQKDKVLFEITADDATALRATINTVMKLLVVYEKSSKIE